MRQPIERIDALLKTIDKVSKKYIAQELAEIKASVLRHTVGDVAKALGCAKITVRMKANRAGIGQKINQSLVFSDYDLATLRNLPVKGGPRNKRTQK